jgi:hypothetical protein
LADTFNILISPLSQLWKRTDTLEHFIQRTRNPFVPPLVVFLEARVSTGNRVTARQKRASDQSRTMTQVNTLVDGAIDGAVTQHATSAARACNQATLKVIFRATSLLFESAFSSFGECILSEAALDTVLQACAAREETGSDVRPNADDLAGFKAAVQEGYDAARKLCPRNMAMQELQEKKAELEAVVAQLSKLVEQMREESDFDHNTGMKALADARDENEKLSAEIQTLRAHRQPPAAVPAAPSVQEAQQTRSETRPCEEPADFEIPAPVPEETVEEAAPKAEQTSAAAVEVVAATKAEPVEADFAAPQDELAPPQDQLAPVPPAEPNSDASSRGTRHRDVSEMTSVSQAAAEEEEEVLAPPPRQLVTCFYNRFDMKLKRTTKLGRNVSVSSSLEGAVAEIKAVIALAFHEDLDIGFVDRSGRRVYITTDEQLAEFVGRQREGRPVVQCFSRDEVANTIRQIGESPMRLARSPVPPTGNNSTLNDSYALAVLPNISSTTTAAAGATSPPPRPGSAMSSRCQTPFDYIAGRDLDDRAIEAEFANLANGNPFVLREDVIRYLDDKYDNCGVMRRHAMLVDTLFGKIRNTKRDKLRFSYEEFALILLRHSQS